MGGGYIDSAILSFNVYVCASFLSSISYVVIVRSLLRGGGISRRRAKHTVRGTTRL